MRHQLLTSVLVAGVAATAACMEPPAKIIRASSVESYARPAADVVAEQGYSEQSRHIADCLAQHPSYDFKTDRYRTSGGDLRRCPR